MKRFLVLLCALFVLVRPAVGRGESRPDPRKLTYPPLTFNVPTAERIVLDNGMILYLMEDHELPQISITAFIRTGGIYEPDDKVGLAGLTGTLIRSGGSGEISPEALNDELEFMASSIESSIGGDAGIASLSSLTKNFPRTLELFAGMLMKPAFRQEKVELARKQSLEGIRRQNDDPKQVADRELVRAIYRATPFERIPTVATINAITRDDLVAFHRRYYHPDTIMMSIAGDFDRKSIVAAVTKAFSGWEKGKAELPKIARPEENRKPEVLFVRKDVSQSVIRMGHLGIDKDNPDLYAVRVLDSILGSGGFNSRLMSEVRTNQGLAYHVASNFDIGRLVPGSFMAVTETKAESTARAIALMTDIIAGMTKEEVTDKELNLAKDSIINSFIFGFTNTASVAAQKVRLEYYDYPAGYLENYRDNIAKVTRADVLRVAKKYLHPDRMIVSVVGNDAKFDKPLATFGPVKEIKLENGTRKP